MRKIATLLTALVVVMLLLPMPAALARSAERFSYGERVDFAGAGWLAETDYSTTNLEIRVFDLDYRSTDSGPVNSKDPGIVLFFRHREWDPVTGVMTETNYEGFSGSGAIFEFDRSLRRAEATFPLRLYGYRCLYPEDGGPVGIAKAVECVEIGEPTVQAHIVWTGVGPITRDAFNDRGSEPPWFIGQAHLVEAFRDAEAEGTVAGDGLVLADGQAAYAVLLRGKYHDQLVLPR